MSKAQVESNPGSGAPGAGILAALAVCTLLPSLGTSIANVALPTFAREFSASFQQVQWIVLAYLLASTTVIVSAGRLGDIAGRRRLLLVGITLFAVASGLCGTADSLTQLIAARAAQGIGAAFMLALTLAFVGGSIPKSRIGRTMGLLGALSATGTALGPTIGGMLVSSLGWPAIFFLNVPLGGIALGLAWRYLPADSKVAVVARPRFDFLGTLVLGLTLGAYALAATVGNGRLSVINLILLLTAGLGLKLFLVVEGSAASPLVNLARLRDPALNRGLLVSALVATVMMATLVVGPFYLSSSLQLPTAHIGLVMSVGPIVAALTGVPAGRLVDRLGAARMTIGGLAGMTLGCAALSMSPAALGLVGYLLPSALLTASYALFQTANNTAVMRDVAPDQRGVVSALLNLSRNLGLITGASVLGAVFSLTSGSHRVATSHATAVATGMHFTFAVAAGLVVLALFLVQAGLRPAAQTQPESNRNGEAT